MINGVASQLLWERRQWLVLGVAMEGGFLSEVKFHSLFSSVQILLLTSLPSPVPLKVRFTSSLNGDKLGTYRKCLTSHFTKQND